VKCQLDATRYFIEVFLPQHVSGTYANHQEHWMLSSSIRISTPNFWMGGGLENRYVGRVYGADGAVYECRTPPSAPYTRPTQRLSRPPPIHKLGAENCMLRLNI